MGSYLGFQIPKTAWLLNQVDDGIHDSQDLPAAVLADFASRDADFRSQDSHGLGFRV